MLKRSTRRGTAGALFQPRHRGQFEVRDGDTRVGVRLGSLSFAKGWATQRQIGAEGGLTVIGKGSWMGNESAETRGSTPIGALLQGIRLNARVCAADQELGCDGDKAG